MEVGSIYLGKVTGLTKFGAFVSLPDGKSGMVHISEITTAYVKDIKDHLSEGQEVRVKLIGIDKENRINLSIRKALSPEEQQQSFPRNFEPREPRRAAPVQNKEPDSFDDKLKAFMSSSESRMSDVRHQLDRRGGGMKRSRKA